MKIILSENQLKFLLPETYNTSRIDVLLDKINAMGINSLTDKEKESLKKLSQGEDDKEDAPYDKPINPEYMDRADRFDGNGEDIGEKPNLLGMFMYFTPQYEELNIKGQLWIIEPIESSEGEQHLHVANDTNDFYVTPFWDGEDSITIETNDGKKLKYKLNSVPANEKEMKNFVRIFYSRLLPKIIEKVV
jgi:hypothetical protein